MLLVSLLTLGAAIFSIKGSMAYGTQFKIQTVPRNDEMPKMDTGVVVASKNMVEQKTLWTLPKIAPKGGSKVRDIPLFKSITIVEIGGELIDMSDPDAPLVRAPVPNKWLLDNGLAFLNQDVLAQDPDGDDFSNLDEWKAKTSPGDSSDHPSLIGKLKGLARRQQNYILEFSAQPDEKSYQVIRHQSSKYPRKTFILKKGVESSDKMFRIDSYVKKEAMSKLGIRVDVSVISITYLPDERSVELVKRERTVIPTYYGKFIMDYGPSPEEFYVKKGETFHLPSDPETAYKLIDIDDKKAVILFESEPGVEEKREIELKEIQ